MTIGSGKLGVAKAAPVLGVKSRNRAEIQRISGKEAKVMEFSIRRWEKSTCRPGYFKAAANGQMRSRNRNGRN